MAQFLGAHPHLKGGRTFAIVACIGFIIFNIIHKRSLIDIKRHMEEMQKKSIPRILHLVSISRSDMFASLQDAESEGEPIYWKPVITYTAKIASQQGFKTRLWNFPEANKLVQDDYPEYIKTWERLKASGQGARMADFFRLLVVHKFGGLYLDVDMIPCFGLEEIMAKNGESASFPFARPEYSQISNGAFSAPRGHGFLKLAMDIINNNNSSNTQDLIIATGPPVLAHAATVYTLQNGLDLPNIAHGETMGVGPSQWTGGDGPLRLGSFAYHGVRDKNSPMNLWHLAFASWMNDESRINRNFKSRCEEEIELIQPWIHEHCNDKHLLKFSDCGKDSVKPKTTRTIPYEAIEIK